jgi:hypothetical protein
LSGRNFILKCNYPGLAREFQIAPREELERKLIALGKNNIELFQKESLDGLAKMAAFMSYCPSYKKSIDQVKYLESHRRILENISNFSETPIHFWMFASVQSSLQKVGPQGLFYFLEFVSSDLFKSISSLFRKAHEEGHEYDLYKFLFGMIQKLDHGFYQNFSSALSQTLEKNQDDFKVINHVWNEISYEEKENHQKIEISIQRAAY